MTSSEKNRQVFIIRIWRELREREGASPEWRGVIECVPSGEQRYLKNLDEIIAFIKPYLVAMGVKVNAPSQVKQWLNWRK